ncbi:hypothetical protein [Actinomadura rugatobispora]|uniref:Uncharacterized protein n=1 Tax=Actinomadura rugatobispora TaxID=1994 RepID=A0ABW0ZSX1_9ACTN|nr:hypothetical protein GCM10010200_035950 [Actinomadura rugatobispora]
MSYEITDLGGDVTLTTIDYATETGPFWYVVIDDTPVLPENPLPLELAVRRFREEVTEATDGDVVDLRQCTAEDLKWAGITTADQRQNGGETGA